MVRPHTGIRATTLVLTGLVVLVLAWLVMRWVEGSGATMPDPGWVGAAAMLFLGGGVLIAGWQVRKFRDGAPLPSMSALRAARTLVLGQAAALTGAALTGWYAAIVLVLLPDADVESQRSRIWPFALHVAVAVALAVAGLVVQHWCRVRPRDEGADDEMDHLNGHVEDR
ncbi:DUF3180 domain-containing protein [Intrasporangium sp. DVR]|uniref:DUF3180 domain-containing protein n=1 Tax=Intrasporangium sp. DVR TaxID=3127867 RepID=UPI0033420104